MNTMNLLHSASSEPKRCAADRAAAVRPDIRCGAER